MQAGTVSTAVAPIAEARPALGRSERISTLDGWRGVAIVLVLAQHAAQYSRFVHQPWANLGTFGVYIFFVLSGYIITMRLIEEREKSSSISLSHFYLRRAFRILPPVFAYLITLYLLSRFFNLGGFHSSEINGSLFFFRNYQFAAHPGGMYTAHFWSLSIEEHFYLIWPMLLLWLRNRRALWFAGIAAVTCSVWRIYDLASPVYSLPGSTPALRSLRTDSMVDGLLVGSALALVLAVPSARAFIVRYFPEGFPLVLGVLLLLNLIYTHSLPSLITFILISLLLAFTLVIEKGFIYQRLNAVPLVWIGRISYSLYVWQQLFLFHSSGWLSIFPFNLICAFAVASCSYYLLERPATFLGKKLHRKNVYASPTLVQQPS